MSNTIKLRIGQILAIAKKDIKIYYTEPPILIFGILFPAFLFMAFALGKNIPFKNLIPGLLGISLFFTGSSVGPYITPWETNTKTLERLLTTPGSISVIVIGDILAAFYFSLGISGLIAFTGIFVFGTGVANIAVLLSTLFLASFCFAGLGTIFSSLPTDKPSNVMMLSNLIRLPIIFISGVFVPVSELPEWGQILSRFSPVTYVTDLLRFALGQGHYFALSINLIILSIFTILFLLIAVLLHRKTFIKRI
ncbi:MAG: ABC transporter permease [Candidatus Marinimicrobia bacterium]|nr:ABC transporter permease [Candidatus Neomarinimicrobiota bacterium]